MGRRSGGSVGDGLSRSTTVFASGSDPRPITVNIWGRPSNHTSDWCLFHNDSNSGSPAAAMIRRSTGALDFFSGGYAAANTGTLSGVITLDTWSMFSATWAADNTLKLFVNGAKLATTTLSRTAPGGSSPASNIGFLSGAGFAHAADLAEFAAWSSVLSEAQVASLYVGAEAGLTANSVGTPISYVKILAAASPEPETVGGVNWTVGGVCGASSVIGSSPVHPTMTSSASIALRSYFITG